MAYVDEHRRSKLPVAAVAITHVAIGYALLSGLAGVVMHGDPWKPLIVDSIPAEPPPPPPHPEPLPKSSTAPTQGTHTLPPPPDSFDRTTTTVTLDPLDATRLTTIDLKPLPPIDLGGTTAPGTATQAAAKGNKGDWIREEDYPSSALRAGEEGIVTIGVTIGANGRVTSCTVTGTSGHVVLDQATCRLYAMRARYAPARDASGTAVPATLTDRVRWQIPR